MNIVKIKKIQRTIDVSALVNIKNKKESNVQDNAIRLLAKLNLLLIKLKFV
jgi:hypothetical protein